jgi:hypothetical protein
VTTTRVGSGGLTADDPEVHPGWRDRADPTWQQGTDSPGEPVPPRLPLDLVVTEQSGEVVRRLADIWTQASPDHIGQDLEEARRIAAAAPPEDAEIAERFVAELLRLERWLRDV